MHKRLLQWAAVSGIIAVAIGAFGAHGLKSRVSADTLAVFETGVRYQFYHTFAVALAGILYERFKSGWVSVAGTYFLTGILLFSGSLYAIIYAKMSDFAGISKIGWVTPVGGLFFIFGWVCLLVGVSKAR